MTYLLIMPRLPDEGHCACGNELEDFDDLRCPACEDDYASVCCPSCRVENGGGLCDECADAMAESDYTG
jgi:hypothetical protein